MNLDDRTHVRRYNAQRQRQPFGPHSKRPSRINWYALVVPACLFGGAMLMLTLPQILLAWMRTS